MRIGKLENKDMLSYHQKGKVEALKAVRQKVSYLVKVLGKKLGDVILIVEDGSGSAFPVCTKQCIILRCGIVRRLPYHQEGLFHACAF